MFNPLSEAHGAEPMNMGSPTSPVGPHHQSQYLPGYLLGDTSGIHVQSPRIWSGQSPKAANRSGATSGQNVISPPARNEVRRPKEKAALPPTKSLFDGNASTVSQTSLVNTPGSQQMTGHPASRSFMTNDQMSTPQQQINMSHNISTGPDIFLQNQTSKLPPSPSQIDPFYTQGETLTSDDILDDTWVTVFGFAPPAASFILQQFSQYGNILRHVVATEGNWMHLHYQSKIQAKKALSKNGKIFGGSIMVGVMSCIDKNVMYGDKENSMCAPVNSFSTPGAPKQFENSINASNKNTPIRPLTAAYIASSSDSEVVKGNRIPQKSNGVVSKAMEYVFGW